MQLIKYSFYYPFFRKVLGLIGPTLLSIFSLHAQTPTTRTYTQKDGLYQVEVLGSFITDDSLLYISEAHYQLAIFDGYQVIPVPDYSNITHGYIKQLYPLKKGCFVAFERPFFYEQGEFHPLELEHTTIKTEDGYFYSQGRVFGCGTDDNIYIYI